MYIPLTVFFLCCTSGILKIVYICIRNVFITVMKHHVLYIVLYKLRQLSMDSVLYTR